MLFGVLGTDDTTLHQPADIGMVSSQSRDVRTPHQIKAAVSDVSKKKLAAPDDKGGARGSHPVKLGMSYGICLNPFVSSGKCFEQGDVRIVPDDVVVDFTDRLYRQPAGFLAAFVSAHAVGDYRQPSLTFKFCSDRLPFENGILVVFALATHVATASHLQSS